MGETAICCEGNVNNLCTEVDW